MDIVVNDSPEHLASDDERNLHTKSMENLSELNANVASSDDYSSFWKLHWH